MEINKIYQGDCLEIMNQIEDNKIDLIIIDPPYGNIKDLINPERPNSWGNKEYKKWDEIIDVINMFNQCNRVLRKGGKLIIFCQDPFTTELINKRHSNLEYNQRAIWLKDNFSNPLLTNKAMVSYTEDILIFTKRHDFGAKHPLRDYGLIIKSFIKYSRQRLFKEVGDYSLQHFLEANKESSQFCLCTEKAYNKLIELYGINKQDWFIDYNSLVKINNKYGRTTFNLKKGELYKSNVFEYPKDKNSLRLHPTQKPVILIKDIIETFSNEGDLILDFVIGSGSTAIACINTNRRFIGIELSKEYCDIANKRIQEALTQTKLQMGTSKDEAKNN